jgi:hypothetical protein
LQASDAAVATDDDGQDSVERGDYDKWLSIGRAMWIANIVALVGLAAWVFWDPAFLATAIKFRSGLDALIHGQRSVGEIAGKFMQPAAFLALVLVASVVTLAAIFLGLFIGSARHRQLRAWLAFTMLVALWLTLAVGWPEFTWQGQRFRMRSVLPEFGKIATALRDDWPSADGVRAGLGTYMAYPQGKPRMLMMLTSQTDPPISAVERADDGTLGFELRGDPGGAWLEWHPDGSTPRGFVGGLQSEYDFGRAAPLGGGWYLVRYH